MPAPDAALDRPPAPLDIRLDNATKTYTGADGMLPVVDNVTLRVAGGTTTALVGPSGCGKSTLLRLVAGLETPDRGTVDLGGVTPFERRAEGVISVAFQEDALLPWRTLEGNIALGRRLARMPPAPKLVSSLISRVGLRGFERRRPAELSGGMRQRAAIARCLATTPRILLLDEPFGAVDALTRRRLNIELPPVWGAGQTTVVMVTHSVPEAVLLADRVVVLSPRPASIVQEIDVQLPHPRDETMLKAPAFLNAVQRVEHALARTDAQGQNAPAPQ